MLAKIFFLFFTTLFFTSLSVATTFLPIPIDGQLKDSSAVVHAVYKGKSFRKLHTGEIVTEASLRIIKSAGIIDKAVGSDGQFSVIYPGGQWEDIVYHVDGSPRFKSNEEVVLLLNNSASGFWISNLSLGKYLVSEDDQGRKVLISPVFPEHPKLGSIPYDYFNKLVFKKFGYYLKKRGKNREALLFSKIRSDKKRVVPPMSEKKREPAAVEKVDHAGRDRDRVSWLLVLFIVLGIISAIWLRKNE